MLCKITDVDKTIICDINIESIKKVHQYAISNEISYEEVNDIIKGKKQSVGDRDEHIYFNGYYKFVISIENTPSTDYKKIYKLKRMSVSLGIQNKYPNLSLLKIIAKDINFHDVDKCDISVNKDDAMPNIEFCAILEEKELTLEESEKVKSLFI